MDMQKAGGKIQGGTVEYSTWRWVDLHTGGGEDKGSGLYEYVYSKLIRNNDVRNIVHDRAVPFVLCSSTSLDR
jgi:hypothetical protein